MLDFAVCQISGKQYKLLPNQPFDVDFLGDEKKVEAAVLLLSKNGDIKIGDPYLKEKLTLENLGKISSKKIRVSKYHPKANYRKTTGHRAKKTKLVWVVKK